MSRWVVGRTRGFEVSEIGSFSEDDVDLIEGWLKQSDDVLACAYYPHSASGPDSYLVHSLAAFKDFVVSRRTSRLGRYSWSGPVVYDVFGGALFSIRGHSDAEFVSRVKAEVPDGTWAWVIDPSVVYPEAIDCHGAADTHAELGEILEEAAGPFVAVGLHPLDQPDAEWDAAHVGYVIRERRWETAG